MQMYANFFESRTSGSTGSLFSLHSPFPVFQLFTIYAMNGAKEKQTRERERERNVTKSMQIPLMKMTMDFPGATKSPDRRKHGRTNK